MSTIKHIIVIFFLSIFISSCNIDSNPSSVLEWRYSDLRGLDAFDGPTSANDLLAVYNRLNGADLQFRLDFLELEPSPESDIYLALDIKPGGANWLPFDTRFDIEWDTLIWIPAFGSPHLLKVSPGNCPGQDWQLDDSLIPRIVRDPWDDFAVISVNQRGLTANLGVTSPLFSRIPPFKYKAFLVEPSPMTERVRSGDCFPDVVNAAGVNVHLLHMEDEIGPLLSDGMVYQRASLILAFWNTFPAYTPAEALRDWNGAHAGPFGGRHGLSVLLTAARQTRIPIVLLDLRTQASLSALDYLGGTSLVQKMVQDQLLILPDVIAGTPSLPFSIIDLNGENPYFQVDTRHWLNALNSVGKTRLTENQATNLSDMLVSEAINRTIQASVQSASDFSIPSGLFLYSPQLTDLPPDDHPVVFTRLHADHPIRWKEHLIIPIPGFVLDADQTSESQLTMDGFTLSARQALIENALDSGDRSSPILFFGGDFSNSAWGSPTAGQAAFRYLARHPWIHVFDHADLLNLGSYYRDPYQPQVQTSSGRSTADQRRDSGDNPILTASWQAIMAIFAPLPPDPPDLPTLRAAYAGQINGLLAAYEWSNHPYTANDCSHEPYEDGQPACLMATEKDYVLFEPRGGRLVYWFHRDPTGLHELIAPGTQFITGLADPTTWDIQAGVSADPASLPGSFLDSPAPWQLYQATATADGIAFRNPDGTIRKTFTWSESGLHVTYSTEEAIEVKIVLGVDPWNRFIPGWGDQYQAISAAGYWNWGMINGSSVEIRTTGSLTPNTFLDSRTWLSKPEDPNFDYPPGHYLPFPLALVAIESQGNFTIDVIPHNSGD